jgi:hypothetical protein
MLISTEDRCTVCAKCTTGLEISWGTPNSTLLLGDVVQVEARFGPFGDSVNLSDRCTVCVVCTTDLEIILGTPDGTPR